MQFYRCKCGTSTWYGSMSPYPCTRCGSCGSDLALSPDTHADPQPHVYVTKYNENTGAPYEICRVCREPKPATVDDPGAKVDDSTEKVDDNGK